MNIKSLLILTVIIPLVGALFSTIFRNGKTSAILMLISSTAALTSSIFLLKTACRIRAISFVIGKFPRNLGIEVLLNIQNASLLILINFIYFCTVVLSLGKLDKEIHHSNIPIFYSLLSLTASGLSGIAISNDLFNIFVFIEIASISSYALAGMGKDKKSLLASIDYLLTTSFGSAFYLIGIGLIFYTTGLLNITEIKFYLASNPEVKKSSLLILSRASLFVGMLIKSSMFPMSFWLIRVYKYSPLTFCSFSSAITTKVFMFTIIKILFFTFGRKDINETFITSSFFIYLGGATALICSMLTSMQSNLRHLFAYSSIAHISYIFLCIFLNTRSALIAAVLFGLSHSLSKFILFSSISLIPKREKLVSVEDLANISNRSKIISTSNIISVASIAGIPGTIGFIAKFYMLKSVIDSKNYLLFVILVLSSVVSATYCIKLAFALIFSTDTSLLKTKNAKLFPNLYPTIFCSFCLLSMGVYPPPLISVAKKIAMYTLYLSK